MMTSREIQMCVADVLQDDEIENAGSILRMLNHEVASSWQAARGILFTVEEVGDALAALMAVGFVTPCAEQPPTYDCQPIRPDQIGTAFPWEAVWFHLEPAGRDAVRRWWETEGQTKYPLVK